MKYTIIIIFVLVLASSEYFLMNKTLISPSRPFVPLQKYRTGEYPYLQNYVGNYLYHVVFYCDMKLEVCKDVIVEGKNVNCYNLKTLCSARPYYSLSSNFNPKLLRKTREEIFVNTFYSRLNIDFWLKRINNTIINIIDEYLLKTDKFDNNKYISKNIYSWLE